jgi:hypothetical protein
MIGGSISTPTPVPRGTRELLVDPVLCLEIALLVRGSFWYYVVWYSG